MLNSVVSGRTKADSDLQLIVPTSASIAANRMLATAIVSLVH